MKAVETKAELKRSRVSKVISVIKKLAVKDKHYWHSFTCNRTTYTHLSTELSFPRVQTCFNEGLKIMRALRSSDEMLRLHFTVLKAARIVRSNKQFTLKQGNEQTSTDLLSHILNKLCSNRPPGSKTSNAKEMAKNSK